MYRVELEKINKFLKIDDYNSIIELIKKIEDCWFSKLILYKALLKQCKINKQHQLIIATKSTDNPLILDDDMLKIINYIPDNIQMEKKITNPNEATLELSQIWEGVQFIQSLNKFELNGIVT